MKRHIFALVVFCSVLAFASTGWSYYVGSIDVGAVDTKLFEASLSNSGDATELAWVNSLGLGTFTISAKYDTTSGGWMATNSPFTYAFDLETDPAYYLIKIGAGSSLTDHDTHFLFQNNASSNYAVINLADLHFGTDNYRNIQSVSRISHLDEFGGTNRVPEPGMLVLFGSGLVGLGMLRKRLKV
jgi:hypothetical protein